MNSCICASSITIWISKTALILRGYDQESSLKDSEFEAGEELTIKPDESNSCDSHAVVVKNNRGKFVRRVAHEKAQSCYKIPQRIKSIVIQYKANLIQLATEIHRYFESTSIHIEVNYLVDGHFYDSKMKELKDLTKQCTLPFVPKKRDLSPGDTPFENLDENS